MGNEAINNIAVDTNKIVPTDGANDKKTDRNKAATRSLQYVDNDVENQVTAGADTGKAFSVGAVEAKIVPETCIVDNHQTPLMPEDYVALRLLPLQRYYQKKLVPTSRFSAQPRLQLFWQ